VIPNDRITTSGVEKMPLQVVIIIIIIFIIIIISSSSMV
jgi:cell division protein FtsL